MAGECQFGVTGLAVMGQNLARNVAGHGFPVAVHNRTTARTDEFYAAYGDEGPITPTRTIEEFVAAIARPRPVLIMVKAGTPCCTYIGADGAGHYVKMVHNGIEYADMQLIAEAYDLLQQGFGMGATELADVFAQWNEGDLNSYLIGITAEVLRKRDAATGRPLVDVILDEAAQKGTGKWTSQSALDLGIPVTTITEAVFARFLSALKAEREAAARALPGPAKHPGGADRHPGLVDAVRDALYASKVVAYAQGFQQLAAAAAEYEWNLDLGAIATIWRGGCIIRARFLDRIK